MGPALTASLPAAGDAFRHEALLYSNESEFLAGTLPFLRGAVEAGEPALAVLSTEKIAWLRDALGERADQVEFADMAEVGHNPARIIPAWRTFLDKYGGEGRPVRGIGEPIWAARSPAELVECQRHESLLNVAFADSPAWWLLCPYDTTSLDGGVLAEAARSHPYLQDTGGSWTSEVWHPEQMPTAHLEDRLPEPTRYLAEVTFGQGRLGTVRTIVTSYARRFGLGADRTEDLVFAVNEVATNSLRHGAGSGVFRLWRDGQHLVCEVRDEGRIVDPLVGRREPTVDAEGGRGLWLANQLCDLVQIRSNAAGSVVRLHLGLGEG